MENKELLRQIRQCEWEEEALQFERFSHADAWELGKLLVDRAQKQASCVALAIVLNGRVVFKYAFPSTVPNNDKWLKRKRNTVDAVCLSTLHVWALLAQTGENLEKDWGLRPARYAAFGGGFPVRVKGTGVIGSICCSGLTHEEDHQLVVNALAAYLHVDLPRDQNG